MKKAFIITSCIETNNAHPLTYSTTRSHFNAEQRFQQTVSTVTTLDCRSDDDTTIYVVDASNQWDTYAILLGYQKNLRFISVKEHFPEIFELVTTHKNKTVCEATILSKFMKKFKSELDTYDFVFKMSGRYFIDRTFDISLFNEQTKDNIFYKKPLAFEWNDNWNYSMVDLRKQQGDNKLRQYCSVLFGWGKKWNSAFYDIFTTMGAVLTQSSMEHLDIETLGYYFTRPYADHIIETDWIVYGFDGSSGKYMRY